MSSSDSRASTSTNRTDCRFSGSSRYTGFRGASTFTRGPEGNLAPFITRSGSARRWGRCLATRSQLILAPDMVPLGVQKHTLNVSDSVGDERSSFAEVFLDPPQGYHGVGPKMSGCCWQLENLDDVRSSRDQKRNCAQLKTRQRHLSKRRYFDFCQQ